jgi:hypothetical protein
MVRRIEPFLKLVWLMMLLVIEMLDFQIIGGLGSGREY